MDMMNIESFIKDLPPKEPSDFDMPAFLEAFDPSSLSEKGLQCISRYHAVHTAYGRKSPAPPVEERLHNMQTQHQIDVGMLNRRFDQYREAVRNQRPFKRKYQYARAALVISLISKAGCYIVRQEYDAMTPQEREVRKQEYEEWLHLSPEGLESLKLQEYARDLMNWQKDAAAKIRKVREGFLLYGNTCQKSPASELSSALSPEEFAGFIHYPVSKLTAAETGKYIVEAELLLKLIEYCQANPYWLFDGDCSAAQAAYEPDENELAVYVSSDIIKKWKDEGQPGRTSWRDSLF